MRDSEKTEPGILRAQAAALRDRVGHRIPDILEACADELSRLTARVAELEGDVRRLGDMADCCVYDSLKEVCKYCRCPRSHEKRAELRRLQAAAQGDTPHG